MADIRTRVAVAFEPHGAGSLPAAAPDAEPQASPGDPEERRWPAVAPRGTGVDVDDAGVAEFTGMCGLTSTPFGFLPELPVDQGPLPPFPLAL